MNACGAGHAAPCRYHPAERSWAGKTQQQLIFTRRIKDMTKVCDLCGWEYNEEEGYPDGGIAPGTKWEDIPDDFVCPLCGAGKDEFSDAD